MNKDVEYVTCYDDNLMAFVVSHLRSELKASSFYETHKYFIEFVTTLRYDLRIYPAILNNTLNFTAEINHCEYVMDFLINAGMGLSVFGGSGTLARIASDYTEGMANVFNDNTATMLGEGKVKLFSSDTARKAIAARITGNAVLAFIILLQAIPSELFNGIIAEVAPPPAPPSKD